MIVIFYSIIILFLLFYIFNKYFFNYYENFERNDNGLLCGTENDICRIDEYGVSSCCDNFKCIRHKSNYQYKVCKNTKYNIPDIDIHLHNIPKIPDIPIPKLPNIPKIPDILPPYNIPKLPNISNFFNKISLKNMFDFCPSKKDS
jgi:hypothetical protein